MKKITKGRVLCLALIGLLGGLAGCCSLYWRPGCPPVISTQPLSQTVKKGTPVTFAVGVDKPMPVFYQWRFNGSNISGATSNSYTITSTDFSDVGAYTVQVWGSPTNESETAYLSVYSTSIMTGGTGGTLGTPIGLFSSQSYLCDGGSFNKGYAATNSDGSIALLYGPNVSPTAQTGIFINSGFPLLTIDTFHADNGTADTGLRIRKNWSPYQNAACDDNSTGGTDPKQSKCDVTLGTVSGQDTYRLSLLYKNPPGAPASGKITINWSYHN